MDWEYVVIAVIALAFVLFVGDRYKALKKEMTEFVEAIRTAIEDGHVDDAEIAKILKEGKDVGMALKEITWSILLLIHKK